MQDKNSDVTMTRYPAFIDRAARELVLCLFLFTMLVGVAFAGAVPLHGGAMVLAAVAAAVAYSRLRKNYPHIRVVGKDGAPAGLSRRLLRRFFLYLPLIVYTALLLPGFGLYASARDKIGVASTACVKAMGPALSCFADDGIILLQFFWGLPFLVAAVLLFTLPAFFTAERRSLPDLLAGTKLLVAKAGVTETGFFHFTRGLQRVFCALALLFAAAVTVWVAGNMRDRPLDPGVAAFFQDVPLKPEDNAVVALTALDAPAAVTDIYAYGLDMIKNGTRPGPGAALSFQGKADDLCVNQAEVKRGGCPDAAALAKLSADNATLLARYLSLYRYKNHDSGNTGIEGFPLGIIALHRLQVALWVDQSRAGNGEAALESWLQDMTFIGAMLAARHGAVPHAFWETLQGLDLRSLPLLVTDPVSAARFLDRVVPLLAKEFPDPAVFNVLQVLGMDPGVPLMHLTQMPETTLAFKPHDMLNTYYRIYSDLDAASRLPPDQLRLAVVSLPGKYKGLSFYDTLGRRLAAGQAEAVGLFPSAVDFNAWRRALTLYTQARSQNIAPKDMEAFVAGAGQKDPFTGKPFQWDAGASSIWFENLDHQRRDVYYE